MAVTFILGLTRPQDMSNYKVGLFSIVSLGNMVSGVGGL